MTTRITKKVETVTPQKIEVEWQNGDKETLKAENIYQYGDYAYLKEYDGMHINYKGELEPKYRTFETLQRNNMRRHHRIKNVEEETRTYTVKVLQKKGLLTRKWNDKQVVHVEEQ